MNETIKSILNRRSVRMFSEESISEEEIQAIVEAGIYAPSSLNNQPWHLSVIENKDIISQLNIHTKEMLKGMDNEKFSKMGRNEKFNVFYNSPLVIVVSGQSDISTIPIDCAAASENMLIAAESLNIGSCWIGLVARMFSADPKMAKEYREKLQIPETHTPLHALAFGYKKIDKLKAPERRENTVSYIK